MSQEPAYLRNLKAITRAEPQITDLELIEKELYFSGSDRATVVMFGSFVEANLERLLTSVMRSDLNSKDRKQLFEYEGAVGTFSSKIIMAYALGLIGPVTRSDLNSIRFLRNEFAHSRMPFDFQTPEAKAVCDQLKIVDEPGSHIPFGLLNKVSENALKDAIDKSHPKTRFICACHTISHRMHVARNYPQAGDFAYQNNEPLP